MENVQHYIDLGVEMAMNYGPKLLLAILTYVIGSWLISRASKLIDAALEKSHTDISLRSFLRSLISVTLKLLLIISVVTMLGVETTSLIAVLGAAGLAIGLALQGSLSNFAGGVLILFFKPFEVGDYIKTSDHEGKVEEIQIFVTTLRTLDNQRIIMPNGILSNQSLVNVYSNGQIRLAHTFGISYSDSIDDARQSIEKVVASMPDILKTPAPMIHVSAHADSAVELLLWSWVKPEDHWAVHFKLYEEVKKEFDNSGISIPFPQRDVHLHNS
ncbi:MAG TPA: mechanosensitive ion channel family protein [Sulfurovum sp.]|nr:mechanosensitive ion channel family protein [Sulfurovum sp.]